MKNELMKQIKDEKLIEKVSYVDFSERFSLSFVLEERCRVELGKLSDVQIKINLMNEILEQKNPPNAYAVVDVSNVEKPTYQTVEADRLFV